MAKLICKDGKEIYISDETEQELRNAFEPKPKTVKVWNFIATSDPNSRCNYVLGLGHICKVYRNRGEFAACTKAYDRTDIENIIRGLQELIKQ